jgi:hypothetical protein
VQHREQLELLVIGHAIFKNMKKYKYTLTEDVIYQNVVDKSIEYKAISDKGELLGFIDNGDVIICRGYAHDGCSPKFFKIGKYWIGTPDGLHDETLEASRIHDFLYQFHKKINACNKVILKFRKYLYKHNWTFTNTYYKAVRLVGGFYWKGDF